MANNKQNLYGYVTIHHLKKACEESFHEVKDRLSIGHTQDVWILSRKTGEAIGRYYGGRAFATKAMAVLEREKPELYDKMIISRPINRTLDPTVSNHPGEIYWVDLGKRLSTAMNKEEYTVIRRKKEDDDEPVSQPNDEDPQKEGRERLATVKVRVGQGGFRKDILEAYSGKCCMTGIDAEELLIASHIKPWSDSSGKEKRNVANGLLLNTLHDHAFDQGLITVSSKGKVEVSSEMSGTVRDKLNGMLIDKIELPKQVKANQEFWDFLEWHRQYVFRK